MPALLLVALLSASPHALKFDAKEDLAVTGAALAVWGGGALLKGTLGPDTCRWCDRNADGTDALNGFDRWGTDHLIWSHPVTAANLSNVAIITLPVAVAGLDFWMASSEDAPRDTLEDLVMIAEATAINGALNEGVKNLAARQRPYAHLAGATGPGDVEDNVSFYSGHSSTAFSLATAAGTIASLRGYEHAWAVWAVGMPLATGIACLRVGGAKHYLTDVLTGALVGGAIGAGVPLLFHARLGEVHAQLVSGPGSVSLVGVW